MKTKSNKIPEKNQDEKPTDKKIEIAAGEKEKLKSFLITFGAMLQSLSPNGQLAFLCFLESNYKELWKKKIDFMKD